MADITAQVSRELAMRDLADIAELRRNEAFTRYFLRRLNQKITETRKSFEDDAPEKVDKDEREVLRRILASYKELSKMLDVDEGTIHAQYSR